MRKLQKKKGNHKKVVQKKVKINLRKQKFSNKIIILKMIPFKIYYCFLDKDHKNWVQVFQIFCRFNKIMK